MTSTLWFWILCLIVLLFVIWFIRKLIWRVIIICVVLFLLFIVWRWISPATADSVLNWLQDLPVRATNYVNTDILNKDIILPLHNPVDSVKETIEEWIDELTDGVDFETLESEWDVEIAVEEEEGPRYSWLSKLFSSDKSDEADEVTVEENTSKNLDVDDGTTWVSKQFVENRHEWVDVKLSENGEIVIETITSSWEKIIDTVAKVWSTSEESKVEVKEENKPEVKVTTIESTAKTEKDETKKVEETTKKEESNEVVYLKSNPKNEETKTTTTKTTTENNVTPVKSVKGLTAEEVREANEIFN